ncbi:MAG TPA: hypothetical protein VMB85_01515 [Bryobacteraceae bacterium]|nr:hypothetical protein [Bryobacteraceae bacterium]
MRTLAIAIGNVLRGDDGVAHAALELVEQMDRRWCFQLTPEHATEIAGYDAVVFIDADTGAGQTMVEPLRESPLPPQVTHLWSPAEIVALARALFRFAGRAFVCRIPAEDFSAREQLSPRAAAHAQEAARQLTRMIEDRCEL